MKKISIVILTLLLCVGVIHGARALEGGTPGKTPQNLPRPVPGIWPGTSVASGSGVWSPQIIDLKRLQEMERKYSASKSAGLKDFLLQQQRELKAKQEQVKGNWKKCEEAILAYKKLRLEDRKTLETQAQAAMKACVPQTATATNSAEKKILYQSYSTCRKDAETKNKEMRSNFEKETRMHVVELQKACVLENQKPASTPQPTSNVQGLMTEDDGVPADTTVFAD